MIAESAKKVLLFIAHQPESLKIITSFLKKRNFEVYLEKDIKEAVVKVFEVKPDFIFIAWDHPEKKIMMLPKILSQSTKAVIVPFINKNSKDALFKIETCPVSPKLYPPISGPAIERLILKSGREDIDFLDKVNKFKNKEDVGLDIDNLKKSLVQIEDVQQIIDAPTPEMINQVLENPPANVNFEEVLPAEIKNPEEEKIEILNKTEKRNEVLSKTKINFTEEQKQGLKNSIEEQVKAPLENILQAQLEYPPEIKKKPLPSKILIIKRDSPEAKPKKNNIFTTPAPVEAGAQILSQENEVATPAQTLLFNAYCISIISPNWCGYFIVTSTAQLDFTTIDLVFTDWIKNQVRSIEEVTERDYFEFTNVEQSTLDDLKKISDYSEQLTAHNYDFNINFFSVEPKDMKVEFDENKKHIVVYTDDIPTEISLDFDILLHLPKNDKFLVYTLKNSNLKEEQKNRLIKNNVSQLYIEIAYEYEYRKFLVNRTFYKLHDLINKKLTPVN